MNTKQNKTKQAENITTPSKEYKGKTLAFSLAHQDAIPVFVEKSGKEFVYWGKDNKYPYFLIELANSSSLHGAIVQSLTRQVSGQGLRIKNGIEDPALQKFIDICNKDGESLYDVLKKIITDYIIFGGFAFNPVWMRGDMFNLYHCDISSIRSGYMEYIDEDEQFCRVNKYFVSDDWSRQSKLKYKQVSAFDGELRTGSQIKYCKFYSPASRYYPVAPYTNCIYWCCADFKVSEFHNSCLDQAFTPSVILSMNNGIPTDEQAQRTYDDIMEQFAGSKNSGKVIMQFNESKETAMDVTVLNANNSDKQYLDLQHIIMTQILAGHGIVNSELVGISTAGKLGNADYTESYTLYDESVIKPKQRQIEREVNSLLSYIGFTNQVEIEPLSPLGYAILPRGYEKIATINECRTLVGLGKIAGGDVIVEPRVITEIGNDDGNAPAEIKAPDPQIENPNDANPDMSASPVYRNRTILNDKFKIK